MLTAQDNACAICRQSFFQDGEKITINVDHDHRDGRKRGLLCTPCNQRYSVFLGMIQKRLLAAITYLRGGGVMAALPAAPALSVVGRNDTIQQGQVADAARAQPYAPPQDAPPTGLAGFVQDQYSLMRRHRDTVGRGWSDRLLAALRAFNGIYEQAIIEEIKRFGGSNVYSRIIAMKCRGTSSLLRDVYLGTDRPWGIQPAPDPDVPDEIKEAIGTVTQR